MTFWRLRAALHEATRSFFGKQGYLEIDTPIAVPLPGTEVYLRYFKTEWIDHQQLKHELWLRSSPEIHLKKALAEGIPRVFEIARCFRNGGEFANWHHPEFTMLEWYHAEISFEEYINQTERFLRETVDVLTPALEQAGIRPFKLPSVIDRICIKDAFSEFAGIDLIDEDPDLAEKAMEAGIFSVQKHDDFETAYFKIQLDCIEPKLKKLGAVVLKDYPPSQAALARLRDGSAKRFEFFVQGIELCNGFEELLDRKENEERIQSSLKKRASLGFEVPQEDQDFYSSLEQGLPQCCGNALGLDRWLALISGQKSLDRIIPFRKNLSQ